MNYSFTCLVKYQNGHTGYLLHSDTSSCSDCSLVILTINPLSKGSFRQDAGVCWFLSGLLHWCKDRKFSISVETWVYCGRHRKTLASCLNKALATYFTFIYFFFSILPFFFFFLSFLSPSSSSSPEVTSLDLASELDLQNGSNVIMAVLVLPAGLGYDQTMELFSRRWSLLSSQVFWQTTNFYATHAWQHSIYVWLLGRSGCSSPSAKAMIKQQRKPK